MEGSGGLTSIHRIFEESMRATPVPSDDNLETSRRKKKRKTKTTTENNSLTSAPRHVQKVDWKDMLVLSADIGGKRARENTANSGGGTRQSSLKGASWIDCKLKVRQCTHFIPSQRYSDRCGCGRDNTAHTSEALSKTKEFSNDANLPLPGITEEATSDAESDQGGPVVGSGRWFIKEHTELKPTDAHGTIIFEGTTHHVNYAKMTFDTDPKDIVHLLLRVWKIKPPKLIITIHGGISNFELNPKLARTFRKGIMKIAKSTDAWILTSGLDEGVVKHVADALQDQASHMDSSVVAIGIAAWGMLKKRGRFVGKVKILVKMSRYVQKVTDEIPITS